MTFRSAALFATLVLVAAPAMAADDLTIVSKVSKDGAAPATSTSYLASDHIRMSQPEGSEMIWDLKSGQMTVVDGRKKEYYLITRQDMEQMKAKLQETMNSPEMKKAQEQMKNLPPDIQKRMQGAMGAMGATMEVKKTGNTRKVAGYSCEEWSVTMGQFSKTLECLSSEVPIPAQTWTGFRDFADSMRGMMAAMGPMAKGMGDMSEKFKEMRGFPLSANHTTSMMGHTSSTTSEVTEIKKGPIPASAWDVPAGYQKVENPMLKGMAKH